MGLFKKRSTDPGEMDRIKADIAAMAARIQQSEAEKQELGTRVQHLVTRLDTPIAPPPLDPPPRAEPAVTQAEIDLIRARVQRLSDRIDQVDARITSISTELANQISELSGDVEALGGSQPAAEGVVAEIRDAQVRLANEQARYQIAFRQDLADLAERLKRP